MNARAWATVAVIFLLGVWLSPHVKATWAKLRGG